MYKVNKAECIVHCTNSRLVNMVEYFVSRSFLKQRSVFSIYRRNMHMEVRRLQAFMPEKRIMNVEYL